MHPALTSIAACARSFCLASPIVPLQLPFSPVMLFAIRIEHPLDMTVKRPHHPDPYVQQRPAAFHSHDQRLRRSRPFAGVLLGLGQLHDVAGGVLEGDELAALRYRDWGFE